MRASLPIASLLFSLAPATCAPPSAAVRCKCGPAVEVTLDSGARLEDGGTVSAGDRLQLCFSGLAGEGGERTLVSAGGAGEIGLVHRWQADEERGGCAPFSLRVDAAPGPERLWITAGEASFALTFEKE